VHHWQISEKDFELRVKKLFQRFDFSEFPPEIFSALASHP
jgi:hypothetical protein